MVLCKEEQSGTPDWFSKYVAYYSCVPNRRVGQNKRAGGKILKKH